MLWIQETYVNVDKRHLYGESEAYETRFDNPGDLYRSLVKEWGRCQSKMYVDQKDADGKWITRHIGWVFVKRASYEDKPKETYLREAWVTVFSGPPEHTIKYHYAELGK